MEQVRRVGEFVWERIGTVPADADPLDFRSLSEPVTVPTALRDAIREAMKALPVVRRVGVSHSKLLKSGEVFNDRISFGIECDGPTAGLGKEGPVGVIGDLLKSPMGEHLRELLSGPRRGLGVTMGTYPPHARPAIVYQRNHE